ncbi:MAG TPA: polysaccharide pyruvyl transferase family protein, partial [Candidatus Woesebacteria bacterium]|nr:polysaccharide pyruvyl transferase family protein [Candidatus Woesebacteria bacterium]
MKILLYADVGTMNNGLYHVGDEAMFLETYRYYNEYHPKYILGVFSKGDSYQDLHITEYRHKKLPDHNQIVKYSLKLLCKVTLFRLLKLHVLSEEEKQYVDVIQQSDCVHFTGGGNLTSVYKEWLYRGLLTIYIARIFGKKVILTSQTIGPFTNFKDRFIAGCILNLA